MLKKNLVEKFACQKKFYDEYNGFVDLRKKNFRKKNFSPLGVDKKIFSGKQIFQLNFFLTILKLNF